MSTRRRMLRRGRALILSIHHNWQTVDNSHHHSLISTTASLRRGTSTTMLICHRSRKDGSAIHKVSWIWLVFCSPGGWCVTLRSFEQTHYVRFQSIRLADRRRFGFVFVGLGMRMVALNWHRVPHGGWYYVGKGFNCVRSVDFVAGHARNFIHPELLGTPFPPGTSKTLTVQKFRLQPFLIQLIIISSLQSVHFLFHGNTCEHYTEI